DYRYFPEPDLPPLHITQSFIDGVKAQMPALPKELFNKFTLQYGLNEYDAAVLTESRDIAEYFETLLKHTSHVKAAANWLMVHIKGYLNEQALDIRDFVLQPSKIAEIIELIDAGKLSHSAAAQRLFPAILNEHHKSAAELAESLNLMQEQNSDTLQELVNEAVSRYPEKVTEYKNGKTSLIGLFMGEVMKLSKGKADPKLANKLVKDTLDNL
ncbi:MAG: Asp-tRNA(Asn)/Glu-tRNA(Gln) amidotransferase GatCAB subunit B, partial [Bacteroidota bacterium]